MVRFLNAVNDVKNAAPCAASYMLFDPKDQVMKQNVEYYGFYREQWGLKESDFLPRPVSSGKKNSVFCLCAGKTTCVVFPHVRMQACVKENKLKKKNSSCFNLQTA